eukprot:3286451-Amphidinium_carterae.1
MVGDSVKPGASLFGPQPRPRAVYVARGRHQPDLVTGGDTRFLTFGDRSQANFQQLPRPRIPLFHFLN